MKPTLVKNIFALYWLQAVNYLAPLVTFVYLTRTVGPSGVGVIAFAASFGSGMGLVIEYGFTISGARSVAEERADRGRLRELLAGVLWAKLLLAAGMLVVGAGLQGVLPHFAQDARLIWGAWLLAFGQGMSMMWFFLGVERVTLAAAADAVGKCLAAALIVLLVKAPEHAWLVLYVQGLTALLGAAACTSVALWRVGLQRPSLRLVRLALAGGRSMFVFRGATHLYTAANSFLLGLFAPAGVVGYYATGERVARAAASLLGPVCQGLFPRVTFLLRTGRHEAAHLADRAFWRLLAVGGLVSAVTCASAHAAVITFFGAAYAPSVAVLRTLSVLPIAIAASGALASLYLLPLRLDNQLNAAVIAAGTLNLAGIVFLVPLAGEQGVAVSVALAEIMVVALMWLSLRGKKLRPRLGASRPVQELELPARSA